MTQTQYINPECEKFTISGVDYYVHPKFTPLGISMNAEVINVHSMLTPKLSSNKTSLTKVVTVRRQGSTKTITVRRMLALAFVPAKEGCYIAGRKYGDDSSLTIDNTDWRNCRKESLISVNLISVIDNRVLHSFLSVLSASKFVRDNSEWKMRFGTSVQPSLSRKGVLVSNCKNYRLASA